MHAKLKTRSGSAVGEEAVAVFAEGIGGEVIRPGDAAYEEARHIWNGLIDKHPGLIVRCRGTADVVACVKFASDNDILVSVRGGGHNVAGRALCDDGLVIDLSAMRGVHVDPATRTVRAQGGATLGDVDRETHLHGLAVPTGVVSKTGIAGLALGGGVGWLVRKYGPTCDNVVAFEVVTADAKVRTASEDENPDLFWALCGGGGNFGVVTSFLFRAYPVDVVLGGLIVWPRSEAASVLRHYRDALKSAPEELTVYAGMVSTPDGQPAVAMIPCYIGDLAEGEKALAPFRGFGNPLMDVVQPMPFPQMQRILNDAFPDGTRNYWKSMFLRKLGDDTIDLLVEHANRMTSPLSAVVIEFYAGPDGRIGKGRTAFAQREPEFCVGLMAQWSDPADDDAQIGWARSAFEALKPHASGRYLINFLPEEAPDVVRAAFGENYGRLAELKRRYDPNNFFSQNQNIKAAA